MTKKQLENMVIDSNYLNREIIGTLGKIHALLSYYVEYDIIIKNKRKPKRKKYGK